MSISPDTGSGNWLVWIQRLMATVAMGLGQFQRFLSCDLGTGSTESTVILILVSIYLKCFFLALLPPPLPYPKLSL